MYLVDQQRRLCSTPMTTEQLRYLGIRQVVYLKPDRRDDQITIYGADGTPLEVVDTIETAIERVAENGLCFVPIH